MPLLLCRDIVGSAAEAAWQCVLIDTAYMSSAFSPAWDMQGKFYKQGGAAAWDCHKDKLVDMCSTKSGYTVEVLNREATYGLFSAHLMVTL